MNNTRWITLAAAALTLNSPVAKSQGFEYDEEDGSNWSFLLEAGAEREPVYTGSDQFVAEAEFNLEASYQIASGHEFFVNLGEAGVRWQTAPNAVLATILEFEPGRDNADDPALDGFPEVEDTVEAQLVWIQQWGQTFAGAGIQYDILSRGKGLVGFFGVGYQAALAPNLTLLTQVDLSFADAEHLQTEVGISEETSAITGLDAYSPGSGYKGITADIEFQYRATPKLELIAGLSVENYGSIMSDSPLIAEEGIETTYEAVLGIRYRF